jgi:hypothetical protein
MVQPRQLARARKPRQSTRALAEELLHVNVFDLKIKPNGLTYTAPNISLRYHWLNGLRITAHVVQFAHHGRIQAFRIRWTKTICGFRPNFICQCGRPVVRLYLRNTNLACRRCTGAIYASQTLNKYTRPLLQSRRLEQFLQFRPFIKGKAKQRLQARLDVLRNKPTNTRYCGKRVSDKAMRPHSNYNTHCDVPLWR